MHSQQDTSDRIQSCLDGIDWHTPGWQLLLAEATIMEAPEDTVLFQHGSPCNQFFIVLSGCARVQYQAPQGGEIILYRVNRGESCALTLSCLFSSSDYPAEGVVEEDLTIAMMAGEHLQQALTDQNFRAFIFANMGQRLLDLMLVIDAIAFQRMDRRLAQLLHHRGPQIYATHQELARELGTAREVVSRLLKDFEHRDWLTLGRGHITIKNATAIDRLACD
jgi:CRP/FNR family transcriptional regulator